MKIDFNTDLNGNPAEILIDGDSRDLFCKAKISIEDFLLFYNEVKLRLSEIELPPHTALKGTLKFKHEGDLASVYITEVKREVFYVRNACILAPKNKNNE